ncbi:MAG: 2-oxo acid dehydrogenase subunit E2 [Gammaproteobacteria bacterium]|nr:2-oxo acid dehydrogenase subunit E2 [Gammaproteobacteria bacterium]
MGDVFKLPDLGEGLREAEIVTWHVGVGDHVVADQPLVAVETDKAIVEVPSPRAGRVAALHADVGDILEVGAPLVEFDAGEAKDTGAIVGDIAESPRTTERAKAAPAVRKLAESLGVDLATVTGTGPGGTISSADVEAAAGTRGGAGEKLRGVRRAMFQSMTLAGRNVVPATLNDEADIDAWSEHEDPTARLTRAISIACKASPALNAWFDPNTETRTLHKTVDLGIAVETGDGLFAPVLRDAGNRNTEELRAELERIKQGIENRSVERAELTGATISLSNFGMFGGRFAELVVLPPQVAILGAGRAEPRVVVQDDQPVVRRILPLSLSFDHRVVTGIEATRFLNTVIEDLALAG